MRPYILHKRGRFWYYRLAGERTFHSTGETARERAERKILKLATKPEDPRITLRAYAEDFFLWDRCRWVKAQLAMERRLSQATARMRRGHLIKWILPAFGQRRMAEITAGRIRDWLVDLPLSGQTRNHLRYTLSIVFEQAVLDGILQDNPIRRVPPFGGSARHHDAFTADELALLFPFRAEDLVKVWGAPRWAAMHYLMVTTGMRVGEAAALIWRDVHLAQYAVVIRQAVKASGGLGPPKNGEVRAAVFPRRTRAVLAWWRAHTPLSRPDDFVFPGRTGRYVDPKTAQRVMTGRKIGEKRVPGVLALAGIETGGRFLGSHSLRTTFNTLMRPLLPEAALQYMMGHKSRAMTELYDGSGPEERIETLLRPVRGQIEAAWR